MAASAKEYNMLFKLSAQLGQEYNATFSSAQKKLTETQKEISALNKLQGDIAGYQKQQQAVESTASKLELYKQQLDNVRREMEESGEYSASLANKELTLKQKIEDTQRSLTARTQKLNDMGASLRKVGVDTDNLTDESAKLAAQMDDLADKQKKAAEEAKSYGTEGVNAFEAVGSALVAVGLTKAFSELVGLYNEAVDGAHKYADEILTVSAQYGVSADKLQSYYYAAELVDVSADTITSSMTKNVRAMYSAAEGTESYIEAYRKLGVEYTDGNDKLRDSEEVYWEVIDALGRMENESERDGIAMELLGKNAMQLNTLIKAGSGTMQSYADEAQKAGYILSDEMLVTLGKLDDAEQRQQNNLVALKNTIGGVYAPELTKLKELENDVLSGITEFASKHPVVVKSIIAVTAEVGTFLVIYKSYQAAKTAMNTLRALSTVLHAKENAEVAKETAATTAAAAASGADAAAKTAEAAATTGATVAQNALNAAMAVNPIFLVVGAVAALTVGLIALTQATKTEVDESERLTASSKKQYDQLQALNAEYEEACRVYGETSEEARALHGELVLLEEDYESSKMTMEEYYAQVEETLQAYDDFIAEREKNIRAINTEEDVLLTLISRLETLQNKTNKTAQEKEQMLILVDQLNERLPTLSLSYDKVTGSVNSTADAIRAMAAAEIARKNNEQNFSDYMKAMEQASILQTQFAEATQKAADAQQAYEDLLNSDMYKAMEEAFEEAYDVDSVRAASAKYYEFSRALEAAKTEAEETKAKQNALKASYDDAVKTQNEAMNAMLEYAETSEATEEDVKALQMALVAVRRGYLDTATAARFYGVTETALQEKIDSVAKHEANLKSAIAAVSAGYYTAAEAAEIYGVTVDAIEATANIQDMIDMIDNLGAAYYDVRDAAEKSIQGQYALWDTAAIVVATDADTINTALETQLSYWSDYNTDLAALLARKDDIDGLGDIIASFADGSAESVNAIAGMAAASDEDLKLMIARWQEVKRQQEEAAGSIAEIATGFADEFDGMQADLEAAVEALNLDEEAAEAAKATVAAYAQAIRDGTDDAVAAANALSSLVALAFLANSEIGAEAANGEMGDFAGANSGTGGKGLLVDRKLMAYASGTDYAKSGLAIVGEEGPELVRLAGGERIYPADETKRMLDAYASSSEAISNPYTAELAPAQYISITISPSWTIEGGTTGDLENRLQEFTDIIVGNVKDAIEEAGINVKRGAYA